MESLNSEGITFKKPRNASSTLRRAGKRPTADGSKDSAELNLNVFRTFEEPSETISRRVGLYQQNLKFMQDHLKRVQDKYNGSLNSKLVNFIQSSFQLVEKVDSVIPIGILESSLSIGENLAIFDYIEEQLKKPGDDQEKVFVSRVQSGTSSSTKAVFQKICGQLINAEESYDDDEESEDSSPVKKRQGVSKRAPHFSLYDVKLFLNSIKQKYKIVLIIEDVDYFSNAIITQILTLMGCAKLPIVFIFGVTHGRFIQNLIPLNSSSEFVLETFYSVSPKERFDDFMRHVLFDISNPFRVSGEIVSYLESQYKEDNFSVEHIFNSLKFCLHYHFLTGKATYCSLEKSEAYTARELELFKEVVEATNSAEASPPKRMKVSKSDTPEDLLNSTVDDLKSWYFFLRLLCYMNLRLRDSPLGDTYCSIFASCYNGYTVSKEADENQPFHRFFKELSSLSKIDLQTLVEECIKFLKNPTNRSDIDFAKDVLIHFEEILSNLLEAEKEAKTSVEKVEEAKPKKAMKLRTKTNIKDLQQSLLEMKRTKDGSSAAYNARTKLVESLRKLLKKFFRPFSTMKYSDVFVFSDLSQLINAMYPANFLQLNEDITSPGYVLQCVCCSDLDPSSMDANLPDVCIIHKILSEHTTKKVDLNLIYHTFISIVQPTSTGRKSKAKDAVTASCLIRFRRAVAELQHMGFVKRSKSKPDEVSRLTWW